MELWTGMLEYVMNQITHVQYDLIHKEYEWNGQDWML